MLVGEFPDEVEGSLQATYHKDPIAEFLRGEITMRALVVLVRCLPTDSALSRAANGTDWRNVEYILHDIDSLLRHVRVDMAAWATKKKQPNPTLLPTPERGGDRLSEALEEEYVEQQREDMQPVIEALFANNR